MYTIQPNFEHFSFIAEPSKKDGIPITSCSDEIGLSKIIPSMEGMREAMLHAIVHPIDRPYLLITFQKHNQTHRMRDFPSYGPVWKKFAAASTVWKIFSRVQLSVDKPKPGYSTTTTVLDVYMWFGEIIIGYTILERKFANRRSITPKILALEWQYRMIPAELLWLHTISNWSYSSGSTIMLWKWVEPITHFL